MCHLVLSVGEKVAMRRRSASGLPSAIEATGQVPTPESPPPGAPSELWVRPAFSVYPIDDLTQGAAFNPADNDGFVDSS